VAGDPGRAGGTVAGERHRPETFTNSRRRLVLKTLDDAALDLILRKARTQNGWLDTPVSDGELRAIYDILRTGPTSANSCPARFVFLRTPDAKARLLPALAPGNVDKTKAAPVTAIIGYDTRFYELMATKLFAHRPEMAQNFATNAPFAQITAFRNGTLQGAYFMIAARAVGLDVGGMSGFDNAKVDAEFFPDGRIRSNFLCNVGHGDPSKVMAKLPRLDFEEACTLL
jgi:3-hydroxypropanoate dehydrogenase